MADPAKEREYFVGVDFGGTKIYAGVFRPDLELVGTAKISTKAQRGAETVIERLARCVRDAVDECDLAMDQIRAVGLGAPGAVDPDKGIVIFAPNLGWENLPLQKQMEKELGVPVFIENDANMQMIGIYEFELGAKPRNVVGIFIGTGIGGGLVLDGKAYTGFNRAAGEIGHMVIDVDGPKCGCGNKGCFEALASRTAIFRRIQEAVEGGEKTVLTELLGKDLQDMRSGHLRKAIRKGDKLVLKIVKRAAEYIGLAVGNVMNLLNPEIIVLGGGIIEALEDTVMPTIIETAKKRSLAGTAKGIEIMATRLGDNAGIIGGAVVARQRSGSLKS
jgi:glucokinase